MFIWKLLQPGGGIPHYPDCLFLGFFLSHNPISNLQQQSSEIIVKLSNNPSKNMQESEKNK